MISLNEFLKLSSADVGKLVRESGEKVVVFPINGTRRWFILEYGEQKWDNPIESYMDVAQKRHVELYKLLFDHGIQTLIAPLVGREILETRDAYMQKMGADGLARVVTHSDFLSFYEEYDVRVIFYGDYRNFFQGTPYEYLSDLFDDISQKTGNHKTFRLFFGAFADNLGATSIVANLAVDYFKKHGKVPDRKTIVEMYYGEYIEKANIFIGFDRLATFDYPLINWGEEDLYFTVAPSLYITEKQLRIILYDHLYTRRTLEVEYMDLTPEQRSIIRQYYHNNLNNTLGTGKLLEGIWVPDNTHGLED
jgi:tuberculosinol/isotuberculosinol synthase